MRDDRATRRDPDGSPAGPRGCQAQDGAAGRGDMLGGLNAGAGGRPGPADPDLAPTPMPPNQHRFADAPFATDAVENWHGIDDPA